MLTAINFNYELLAKANKIDNIDSHRLLSSEFGSLQLHIAQPSPQHLLSFCLLVPESFCQTRSLWFLHSA